MRTIREALDKVGMVQGPDESLAETLARALGPTACRDLGGTFGEQLATMSERMGCDDSGPLSVARLDGDENVYLVLKELLNETRGTTHDRSVVLGTR